MLAQIEGRGAHEVADVLDEELFDVRQVLALQRRVHHGRVQVAGVASGDLLGGYPFCEQAARIVVGGEVALDHRDAELAVQRVGGRLQQGRLARAGRGHEVDHEHVPLIEIGAIAPRLRVVVREQVAQYGLCFARRGYVTRACRGEAATAVKTHVRTPRRPPTRRGQLETKA